MSCFLFIVDFQFTILHTRTKTWGGKQTSVYITRGHWNSTSCGLGLEKKKPSVARDAFVCVVSTDMLMTAEYNSLHSDEFVLLKLKKENPDDGAFLLRWSVVNYHRIILAVLNRSQVRSGLEIVIDMSLVWLTVNVVFPCFKGCMSSDIT